MASEHFRSEKLAINRFFSVSKIEFKKLSSAFEAESFEKLIAGRALNAETTMAKVFKEFANQPDGTVLLMLHTKDKPTPKPVEGINFAGVPEETRTSFVQYYGRQLDNYALENRTGNFSTHLVSKHDARYGQTTKEEVEYWAEKGIVMR